MNTEILSEEVERKLSDLDLSMDGVNDTIQALFRIELDYNDSIPEGITKRDQLIQKLKDGLYEANMIMGQIKP